MDNNKNYQSLQSHLRELRNRILFSLLFLIFAFVTCYLISDKIYEFLLKPFIEISQKERKLIYTSPSEAFLTYLKLSFHSALFISTPIFLSQIYLFLAPALYKKEKKNILSIFFLSSLFFISGVLFSYFLILPIALKFFISFESQNLSNISNLVTISLETKISEYLSFTSSLIFGFGLAFQLPVLLIFLMKINLLSAASLKEKRKYWVILFFIISAMLTPPDIISQVTLAILLAALFEIAILFGSSKKN